MHYTTSCLLSIIIVFTACTSKKLPVLNKNIPDFTFINQDSITVTPNSFKDKIYVADFFFTSCPTICPKLTQQMLRIHDHFKTNDQIYLLSHSIDTKRDTVEKLQHYAENLGVQAPKWQFVTGDKTDIFNIAESYFNIAIEDETLPGGYDHSGRIVLVDKKGQIRSYCNGVKEEEVDRLIQDIEKLLNEK